MADDKNDQDQAEAVRLKTLAEQKYSSSNLKSALKYAKRAHRLHPTVDGLPEMLTAFKILRTATKPTNITTTIDGGVRNTPDYYKILQIEPFSHINTIKKQYKKLALTLHPDKNPFVASEEAFKLVGEAFRVLSDKIRRKEYDMKLRIAMQEKVVGEMGPVETFWTACSMCRLLHQFERKYLGHNLMCPSCKKSFKALEVSENVSKNVEGLEVEDGEEGRVEVEKVKTRVSARMRVRSSGGVRNVEVKQRMSSVGEVLERSRVQTSRDLDANGDLGAVIAGLRSKSKRVERMHNGYANGGLSSGAGVSVGVPRLRLGGKEEGKIVGVEVLDKSASKRAKVGEEMMTLAEMQMLAKKKVSEEKMKLKLKEERENEKEKVKERSERLTVSKGENLVTYRRRASKSRTLEIERQRALSGNLDIMVVEDSDFYDFDKGRMERNFKKGQVWAIYDDDDGMPRHYALIDAVVSVYPFEVKMFWLDFQNNGDEGLICREKMGFHISCGRFKVSRETAVNSVKMFSHIVDCERAAREVYRIYPKKGSVWALYNENSLDPGERNPSNKDKRCYDIVIFLTSYSEIHGLSMAYLEKVDGYKTVFKRKEIGCHAIRWLEKDDAQLFSHQIPSRKLSGEEASELPKDCWELDPASLPPELLTIGWRE
ncbi:unnamed protein product [Ilex paraguariensis]|uniref:J domain-containing protein n=1 Tax=Ilex paraguariensis TaxID=185542 RepID=A0ABC8SDJ0_9AQUA